jgi:hypothetical protein
MDNVQVISCPMCREKIVVLVDDEEIFCDVCIREFRYEDEKLVEQPISNRERSPLWS